MGCKGSTSTAHGVRVDVTPFFIADQSAPAEGRFVFGYRIRVTNQSDRPVQLLSRRWEIVDADGDRKVVEGEGVVGQQPRLEPGQAFLYSSYCPLETSWGTMEGHYVMAADDGQRLTVPVGRFFLVAPAVTAAPAAR